MPVTVTASRIEQPLADVPAHVTVIDRQSIDRSAARTVDDLLRSVPGFSLFRRSSSIVAHPTSQGVSLRGVGPTGASRTLVLLDGVPLNDSFGGWVYWSKVPLESVERIEIVRGGGASVWGNYAMAGVINIITYGPASDREAISVQGGNRDTARGQGLVARNWGRIRAVADLSFFDTDGYHVIARSSRGSIDVPAFSEHRGGGARVDYDLSARWTLNLRGRYYAEDRGNGTPLTGNRTRAGFARAGLVGEGDDASRWTVDVFSHVQDFSSTFSRQELDRASESLVVDQFEVPSTSVGVALGWSRPFARDHLLSAGADYLWVDGETKEEFLFADGVATRRRRAGGEQHLLGAYVQDLYSPTLKLELAASLRADYWRSTDASRRQRDLTTGALTETTTFSDRDALLVSPKLGVLYRLASGVSVRGSYYHGFRAPTVNELFRGFRVRNDVTAANPALDPERMIGADLGLDLGSPAASASLTAYWNRLDDAIANVTQASNDACGFVPSGGLCRQRQNLGHSRVLGLEAVVGYAITPSWDFTASYLLSDSEIIDSPTDPTIEGRAVPQTAVHQGVISSRLHFGGDVHAGVEVRYEGKRFEDDRNRFELEDYVVADASLTMGIGQGWELFVGGENLFGRRHQVGKSAVGVVSVGAPALVHAGVRYRGVSH